jgi:HD-GYP domain-containing protein (c-di-GMP phosphodiesterase class II)
MSDSYQKQLNQSGEALLKAIGSLTQITKIHMDNNALLREGVLKFIRLIKNLGQGSSEVSIHLSEGRFYYQEQKLFMRPANAKLFNHMLRFFEDRNVFGFTFKPDLNAIHSEKIVVFFRLVDQAIKQEAPSSWLAEKIMENDLNWVSVARTPFPNLNRDITNPDEQILKQAIVKKTYANVMSSVKEVARKLSSNQGAGLRNSVRLVQKMVDIIIEDETLFMGVSTIRIYDDYTYAHSLNVAILAVCLGKRIGLSHIMLERLGLCGLFHDLGKVEIPTHVLNKKGALSEAEYALLQTHSMHSARLILRLKTNSDRKNKILVPPFEHHMGYDNSGYPKTAARPRVSLFGRILTIVDVYDAITSPRIYRKEAMSPDKALGKMIAQSGTHFDPILLKVFINMLGKYPIGTLLELNNGEMGIVLKPSGSVATRPVVQLIVPDSSEKFRKGAIVDLSERDEETGHYYYTIAKSLHPSSLGIQALDYISNA